MQQTYSSGESQYLCSCQLHLCIETDTWFVVTPSLDNLLDL